MKRKIAQIDQAKCMGCGHCVLACRGNALGFADGKIDMVRAESCDGMGQCMPVCLAGAITFVEVDASEESSS